MHWILVRFYDVNVSQHTIFCVFFHTFHKTLPGSNAFVNWILVRLYILYKHITLNQLHIQNLTCHQSFKLLTKDIKDQFQRKTHMKKSVYLSGQTTKVRVPPTRP